MKPMKQFFTLIEILTVAAIIAILAGISVGVIGLINNKTAEAKTQATIKALELALGQFKTDNGHIYLGSATLNTPSLLTVPNPSSVGDLKGTLLKYLDQKLLNSASKPGTGTNLYFVDGWGRPLIYRIPGKFNKTGFDLGSVGPDGKVGDAAGAKLVSVDDLPSYQKKPDDPKEEYEKYFGQGDDIANFMRD